MARRLPGAVVISCTDERFGQGDERRILWLVSLELFLTQARSRSGQSSMKRWAAVKSRGSSRAESGVCSNVAPSLRQSCSSATRTGEGVGGRVLPPVYARPSSPAGRRMDPGARRGFAVA
jgi:hypothetical protein